MKFDTKVLHSYPVIDPHTGAASIPKYQTSTFHQNNFPEQQDYSYTRFGNPTIEATEKAIASLEKGTYGIAFSSGMAAITAVLFLLNAHDHIVLGKKVYGGTFQLLTELLDKFEITYTFVDESDINSWKSAIQENTKMFYIETPSNPLLSVTDIAQVCELAKSAQIITVCDNTFMTPYYQNPLDLGVDIVVHSATKFLGGHSDLVMGFAVTNQVNFQEKIEKHKRILGAIPGIEESWLLLRGLKTFALRMKQASYNAQFLAKKLGQLSNVKALYYPGNENHSGHEIHFQQAKHGGAVLSFELENREQVENLFKKVNIPIVAVSLGGVESILSYPWTMSHGCMPEKDRLEAGISPTLIRLSCGIEDSEDLWADIKQALTN